MRFLLGTGPVLPLASCGSVFIGFVSNPGGATTVNGIISVVILGSSQHPGGLTTFTAVTFINPGNVVTINFCGDQRNLFPMNQSVRADFTSGLSCSVLIKVVVIT